MPGNFFVKSSASVCYGPKIAPRFLCAPGVTRNRRQQIHFEPCGVFTLAGIFLGARNCICFLTSVNTPSNSHTSAIDLVCA